jgi:hypothetical protein
VSFRLTCDQTAGGIGVRVAFFQVTPAKLLSPCLKECDSDPNPTDPESYESQGRTGICGAMPVICYDPGRPMRSDT